MKKIINYFKTKNRYPRIPITYEQSQSILTQIKPFYDDLTTQNITQDIHSMGVYPDRKTGEPYVYIHFNEDTLIDVHSLPKNYEGVNIRYVKSKIAQS